MIFMLMKQILLMFLLFKEENMYTDFDVNNDLTMANELNYEMANYN